MAKFDGDLWKTNEVAAPQSREILQTFVMWENKLPPPPPMQTSVTFATSSPGRFSLALEVGREKALASAGHMTTKHPQFVGVLN